MAGAPYSDAVLAHLREPHRAGSFPREQPGVARGLAEESESGHLIEIELVLDGAGRIADGRFRAFGCPATIAAASALLERAIGREGRAAAALEPDALASALALAEERRSAAVLATRALRRALAEAGL